MSSLHIGEMRERLEADAAACARVVKIAVRVRNAEKLKSENVSETKDD